MDWGFEHSPHVKKVAGLGHLQRKRPRQGQEWEALPQLYCDVISTTASQPCFLVPLQTDPQTHQGMRTPSFIHDSCEIYTAHICGRQ